MAISIKGWRSERNLSQRYMAKALGISIPTYEKWERNPELIPIGKCERMAEIFGVDLGDIVFLPHKLISLEQ